MAKYLSLDASLSNCGYCIVENEQYLLSGQFRPIGKDWVDKIQSITRWLYSLTMKHRFDTVFYEYPSGQRNHNTTIKLGSLMYAVHLFCRLRDIRFVTVKPSEVTKTGIYKVFDEKTNKVDTIRIMRYIQLKPFRVIYHYDTGEINKAAMKRQDDEIDACGIMKAGIEKIKNGN